MTDNPIYTIQFYKHVWDDYYAYLDANDYNVSISALCESGVRKYLKTKKPNLFISIKTTNPKKKGWKSLRFPVSFDSCYYWISLSGKKVRVFKSFFEEIRRKFQLPNNVWIKVD